MFEVLGEENIGYYFFVHFRRIINFGDDALAEYGRNIIGSVGLVVFLVYLPSNICILLLV